MNAPEIKISVIVPNYNYERYLKQRIESVLNQTYPPYEVILMDDCSTDGSVAILESYRKHPLVSRIMINDTNSGSTFKQWDKGIKVATGDYIWIAESDDFCDLHLLEELVTCLSVRPNTVIAYSTVMVVNQDGEKRDSVRLFPNQYFTSEEYLKKYLSMSCAIRNASSVIFSRSAALSISRRYVTSSGAGDYWFWTELAMLGDVSVVNKQLSYFRRHDATVSSKKDTSGANFLNDHLVYEMIAGKVQLGWFRKILKRAYMGQRIRTMKFDSEDIRRNVESVWGVSMNPTILEKLLLRVYYYLIKRFNYYI